MLKAIRMKLGGILRTVSNSVFPDYWVCSNCGNIEWREREVRCWECGIGDMIYLGRTWHQRIFVFREPQNNKCRRLQEQRRNRRARAAEMCEQRERTH